MSIPVKGIYVQGQCNTEQEAKEKFEALPIHLMRIVSNTEETHSTAELRFVVDGKVLGGVISAKFGNASGELVADELVQVTITCLCTLG